MSRRGMSIANPLMQRELRTRGRSSGLAVAVVGGLLLLCAFAGALFALMPGSALHTAMFAVLAFQLAATALVAATVASGTIVGEREEGTFDLLLLGRLTPTAIVWTKLLASMLGPALLLAAGIPVVVGALLYAGVGLRTLFAIVIVTAATALAVTALGLVVSARSRHSAVALLAGFGATITVEAGIAVTGLIPAFAKSRKPLFAQPADAHPLLFANPAYALHALVTNGWGGGSHIGRLADLLLGHTGAQSTWGPVVQPWQAATASQLLLTVLFVYAAAHSVAAPRTPARPSRLARLAP